MSGFFYFVLNKFGDVLRRNIYLHTVTQKTMAEQKLIKREHISARIDRDVTKHCEEIAYKMKWPLSAVIELAMRNIKLEDCIKEVKK